MSSGFISEKEIAEAKKKRQDEWEKVRTADQPLEAPDEEYDPRSLFERLEEQRQKRDLEYEESRKLKNMIKGLDDDEIDFLDLVDQKKMEAERNKSLDEERELTDFRNRVATLQEKTMEERLEAEKKSVTQPKNNSTIKSSNYLNQTKLFKGVVVKINRNDSSTKRKSDEMLETALNGDILNKRFCTNCIEKGTDKASEAHTSLQDNSEQKKYCGICTDKMQHQNGSTDASHATNGKATNLQKINSESNIGSSSEHNKRKLKNNSFDESNSSKPASTLKCIGILPGLGSYADTSSDTDSESSDVEDVMFPKVKYDMCGRKIEEKKEH